MIFLLHTACALPTAPPPSIAVDDDEERKDPDESVVFAPSLEKEVEMV